MIKRLRRNIITVNMALVGAVILLIFTVICFNSYNTARNDLFHGMNELVNRDDRMNDGFNKELNGGATDDSAHVPPDGDKPMLGKRGFKGDKPVEISSYVLVTVNESGSVTSKTESNATMDDETLEKCIPEATADRGFEGELSEYGLLFVKRTDMNGTTIIFADNSSIYSSLRGTALISLALFAGSMVVLFLISLVLSGFAVKPVKKAWEQQKQFVADASHELKTPLTVILANNNIMSSHPDSTVSEERQWLESTQEEATHMKKLIDQMLFLAKSDAGASQMQQIDVDLSEITEGTALNFEPVAFEKEIDISAEISPGIIVKGNPTELNQLVHILTDNAVKYADRQTTVTIELKKKGDNAEFSVNNRGNVISKEDIQHIFDRFYRAEKSRTTKGYGLGLSIAQRIVEGMNGKLSVTSDEENGTTFTAVLPM